VEAIATLVYYQWRAMVMMHKTTTGSIAMARRSTDALGPLGRAKCIGSR
jgi:hypothetical protein